MKFLKVHNVAGEEILIRRERSLLTDSLYLKKLNKIIIIYK